MCVYFFLTSFFYITYLFAPNSLLTYKQPTLREKEDGINCGEIRERGEMKVKLPFLEC